MSYVFFKLSVFQKDHAEQRVYPLGASKAFAESSRSEAASLPGA
jgi:hypothetical protein